MSNTESIKLVSLIRAFVFAYKTKIQFASIKHGDVYGMPSTRVKQTPWAIKFVSSPKFNEEFTESYCNEKATEICDFYANMTMFLLDGTASPSEKTYVEIFTKEEIKIMDVWRIKSAVEYFFEEGKYRFNVNTIENTVGKKIEFTGNIVSTYVFNNTKFNTKYTAITLVDASDNLVHIKFAYGTNNSDRMDKENWNIGDQLTLKGTIKSSDYANGLLSRAIHLSRASILGFKKLTDGKNDDTLVRIEEEGLEND